jgi:fused signal recognition particle receptor
MFSKLRDKLKNWAKKISEKKSEEAPKKPAKAKKQKSQKKKKTKQKLQQEEIEIPIPTKFEAGTQKYEPDLKEIKKIEETLEKEPQKEPEKKGFFQRIGEKISSTKISEEDFAEYSEELELLLLENNVALEVSEKIIQELKEKIVGKEIPKKEIEEKIKKALKEIIEEILVEPFDLIEKIKQKNDPFIILFCGINGGGKTTTIAKFASILKSKKISCIMAAADTFRAAAIDQIKKHGENLGINVISHEYGTDPASVGFDAINYAKKNKIKCVLIDTAGRIHTAKNLMIEIEKIKKVCNPDIKIFVGESITGNDAVEQVRSFDEAISIDGIILSKADIDEKGGTALSVGYVTKKPILYLGTGQEYDKLEKFDKSKFIKNLGL